MSRGQACLPCSLQRGTHHRNDCPPTRHRHSTTSCSASCSSSASPSARASPASASRCRASVTAPGPATSPTAPQSCCAGGSQEPPSVSTPLTLAVGLRSPPHHPTWPRPWVSGTPLSTPLTPAVCLSWAAMMTELQPGLRTSPMGCSQLRSSQQP